MQPKNLNEVVDIMIDVILKHNEVNFVKANGIPHHGVGTNVRNSFHLWWSEELRDNMNKANVTYPQEKPELVQWFNERDIYHPDDMSGIISNAVKAKLNDEEYNIKVDIEKYKKHWK